MDACVVKANGEFVLRWACRRHIGGGKMPLELLDLARLGHRALNGIDQ
jgi:hypothetical protein